MAAFGVKVLIAIPGSIDTKFNAPQRAGTPLPGYEPHHGSMDAMIKFVGAAPKADPVVAVDVLIDVIRGEGRAAGHKSLPLWLFLGDDCIEDVRARLSQMGSVVDEWEAVGSNLGPSPAVCE
jgi:hypothetical protein